MNAEKGLRLPVVPQSSIPLRKIDEAQWPARYLNPGELSAIVSLVESVNPSVVVEIGVNEGRTAAAVLRHVRSVDRYVGVDVLPGYEFGCRVQRAEVPKAPGRMAVADPRFDLVLSPLGSFDCNALPACDVVFIDGDHSRKAVEHDTALARAAVRPGGIIIWHDYHDLGTVDVRDVLHDMLDAGHKIVHLEGTWLAFERV
jgi:predicted O-methyltransferase YrrM